MLVWLGHFDRFALAQPDTRRLLATIFRAGGHRFAPRKRKNKAQVEAYTFGDVVEEAMHFPAFSVYIEENVKISRGANEITVDVSYVVPIDFPGFTYQWKIHHLAQNPIF